MGTLYLLCSIVGCHFVSVCIPDGLMMQPVRLREREAGARATSSRLFFALHLDLKRQLHTARSSLRVCCQAWHRVSEKGDLSECVQAS